MHHFGGGYADIKMYTKDNNWVQSFSLINKDKRIDVIGTHEVINGSPFGQFNNPIDREKLLGNGFFIVRKNTEFTTKWYDRVLSVLDKRLPELRQNPATEPFGGKGYPLRWAEVQGEIFHKLIMEMYDRNPEKFRNVLRTGWDNGKQYR